MMKLNNAPSSSSPDYKYSQVWQKIWKSNAAMTCEDKAAPIVYEDLGGVIIKY